MGLAALICAVTAFLIIALIWLIATIHTIFRLYCGSRQSVQPSLHGYLRSTSLVYLVSYSLAYLAVVVLTGLALNDHEFFWSPNPGWNIMLAIIGVLSAIGFLSFYLFITARLFYTFKDSQYSISERTRDAYIILSVFVCILLVIYLSSYFMFRQLLRFALPVAATAVLLNLGVAISLTFQFTRKLTQCASFRRESVTDLHDGVRKQTTLSDRQEGLLVVAARHCALSCVGISMFNVFIPGTISIYVWAYPHNVGTYLLTLAACFALHTIEMISVLFSFGYNQQYYYRFCKPCDKGCNMLLHCVAEKRLDHIESQVNRLQSMSSGATLTYNPHSTDGVSC